MCINNGHVEWFNGQVVNAYGFNRISIYLWLRFHVYTSLHRWIKAHIKRLTLMTAKVDKLL